MNKKNPFLCFVFVFGSLFSSIFASETQLFSQRDFSDWQPKTASFSKNSPLELPLNFPTETKFFTPEASHFITNADATHIDFDFQIPKSCPTEARITIYAIDDDFLWWQITQPLAPHIRIPIYGQDAAKQWKPRGHFRTWNTYTPQHIQTIGFIFGLEYKAKKNWTGSVFLNKISVLNCPELSEQKIFTQFNQTPKSPTVGEKIELSFNFTPKITTPFNPKEIQIQAVLQRPDKQLESIRCFYYEDFLYNPKEWDKTKCLTPYGAPTFKLRYTPVIPGSYQLSFHILHRDKEKQTIQGPSIEVQDASPPFHGYVQCEPKDNIFLQYEDGTPFFGLGMNVRSPFDNRYKDIAPYSQWQNMGLAAYDTLFAKYHKVGINVVEVWMSSWWLALEWIPDAPGFHGVGHYNQYRAWMLDHILQLAEKYNIYLILVLNNHGKFGMAFDSEWDRNPYNMKNGGFLNKCQEYFTDNRAKTAFKNTADYIVARWGYSPNILCWKLFTEVDLTGPNMNYYHHPSVAAWHQEMARYLHKIDINHHLVTTHWMLGYYKINHRIAVLPQLDVLTTDAYYMEDGNSESIVDMLHAGTKKAAEEWHKPLIITEFGGSSYADNMGNLTKQIELGLWTGLFDQAAILPMYWWFALVEDKDLYHYYTAIHNYASTEDRRNMTTRFFSFTSNSHPLSIHEMRNNDRILVWIYDPVFFYTSDENTRPQIIQSSTCGITAPPAGNYQLEYWNTSTGNIIKKENITVANHQESLKLNIPAFTRSIAAKITLEK